MIIRRKGFILSYLLNYRSFKCATVMSNRGRRERQRCLR